MPHNTGLTGSRYRLNLFISLYTALILVGSLYPLSGWAPLESASFQFLTSPWPRYITRTDLATNFLAYTPLGYALTWWFSTPGHRLRGVVLGPLSGLAISLILESLQQLLPGRNASNLDILVNGLGALTGALLTLHHGRWLRAGNALRRWRGRWFLPDTATNLGLILLLLWFVTQFSLVPITGIGWLHLHLRPFDNPQASLAAMNAPWLLAQFAEIATLGAFTACLLRPGRYAAGLAVLLITAFITKLLAATLLLKIVVAGGVLSLETLGAFLLALWLLLLPALSRHRRIAALMGVSALILIRLLLAAHFLPGVSILNITGLAQHLGALWPVLGLAWLVLAPVRPALKAARESP